MRIEINAGGLDSLVAIDVFQADLSSFIANTEKVIDYFKAVKTETYNLDGGIGNLKEAIENIETRIDNEETKHFEAGRVQQKTNEFIELAARVDSQVAIMVNRNKDEFYRVNPWLRPAVSSEEKTWYEQAWDWICGAGEAIATGLEKAWDWIKDTASKAWESIVDFYEKHKEAIAAALLVVAAIAVLILVPATWALAPVLIGAAWGTIAGAAIGGVSSGLISRANGGSFWEGFEHGAFSGALGGAISGAAFAGLGMVGQLLGKGISSLSTIGKAISTVSAVTKALSLGMTAFDTLALADLIIDPTSNPLYDLNNQAHSSSAYNTAQIGISTIATFTGGISSTMNSNPVPEQAMDTAFGSERGINVDGKQVSTLADYYPGADSNVDRTLLEATDYSGNNIQFSDKYYSVPTENGGEIYVSTTPINANDVYSVVAQNPNEKIVVITGTHGDASGNIAYSGGHASYTHVYNPVEQFDANQSYNPKFFYEEDFNSFHHMSNVEVVDIRTLVDYSYSSSTGSTIQNYQITPNAQAFLNELFTGKKTVVCGWCYSERSELVKNFLGVL